MDRRIPGGSITGSVSLDRVGSIISFGGDIASVTVGDSIIAGLDASSGTLTNCEAIRACYALGPVTVKGSLIGNDIAGQSSFVLITGSGHLHLPTDATTDLAIGNVKVGGRVEFAKILGGFRPSDTDTSGFNGNAQIGAISVGGDWIASSVTAGINDGGAAGFGTTGNTMINNFLTAIIPRIASMIKGTISGSAGSGVTLASPPGKSAR